MNGQHYQTVALEQEWLYEVAERKRLDQLEQDAERMAALEEKYPQLKTWGEHE